MKPIVVACPRTGKVVNKLERQLAEIYKKVKSLK